MVDVLEAFVDLGEEVFVLLRAVVEDGLGHLEQDFFGDAGGAGGEESHLVHEGSGSRGIVNQRVSESVNRGMNVRRGGE